jgi:hypothetical protein
MVIKKEKTGELSIDASHRTSKCQELEDELIKASN